MKGIFLDDNMSNLTTSASNEAISLSSSSNRNEIGTMYPPPQMHQSFGSVPITTNNQTQSNKKKRNLPGNPDPEAEVVALSPKSLMATNRFICEICNKGFQRDQNLQLHRRGHNLPWKLKQKSKLEVVRKKVYVCPEPSCVHHEPSRALGDLTGIKKHFSRKHGEKKWKCDKCSKRYAVQSDWKAHSKICGTREYRCDCGTLFSRRDSFITHRAFCDALAEETGRSSSSSALNHHLPLHLPINFPLKTEQQQHFLHPRPQLSFKMGSSTASPHHHNHQLPSWLDHHSQQNHPANSTHELHQQLLLPAASPAAPCSMSTHMTSATALLQKAAQMGVTMSSNSNSASTTTTTAAAAAAIILNGSHQLALQQHDNHMCAPPAALLSSHHHHHQSTSSGLLSSLSASDNNHQHVNVNVMLEPSNSSSGFAGSCMDQLLLLHPNSNFTSTTTCSVGSAANNNIHELIFNSSMLKKDNNMNSYQQEVHAVFPQAELAASKERMIRKDHGGKDDELTRDFLGLRGLIPNNNNNPMTTDHHFLDMAAGFDQQLNPNHNQNQIPWQG